MHNFFFGHEPPAGRIGNLDSSMLQAYREDALRYLRREMTVSYLTMKKRVSPEQVGNLVAQVDEGSKLHELSQAVHNVQKLHNLQKVECRECQDAE